MKKPRLLPTGVPWRISASTPFMKLLPPEGGMGEKVQVTFVALFGCEANEGGPVLPTASIPRFVEEPGPFQLSEVPSLKPYRMIRLSFFEVADSWSLSAIDEQGFEEQFDWTIAKEHEGGQSDWDECRRRFWKTWRQTGICPDPLMYEVDPPLGLWKPESSQDSFLDFVRIERIESVGARFSDTRGLHHFLLLGHDDNVEIIAKRWTWEVGQDFVG